MKIINRYILALLLPLSVCNRSKNLSMHKDNQFFVKNNKTQVINLPLYSEKILDLNLAICDTTGIPPSMQQLFYNGKKLDSSRYLSDYNLNNGCCIDLSCKLVGGTFEFSDLRKDPTVTNFSDTAPAYRTISRGLNLEGQCQSCGKWVWVPKGIGIFNIAKELKGNKCPNCSVIIWPKQFKKAGMFNCSYTSEGSDDYGQDFKNNRYTYDNYGFHYYSGDIVNWLELTITTKI